MLLFNEQQNQNNNDNNNNGNSILMQGLSPQCWCL